MNRVSGVIVGCLCVAFSASPGAQRRPHDQVMRDVNATFTGLKSHLEAKKAGEAAADATRLSQLFEEVESFWATLPSGVARNAARGARETANRLAAAARVQDLPGSTKLYSAIEANCRICHERHRLQMPDKTYRIRP